MRIRRRLIAVAFAACLASAVFAQQRYSGYFHALSDLRAARWLLDHVPGDWVRVDDELNAVHEIDGAIDEMRRASIDDGRNVDDHPAMQERYDRPGRLRDAEAYLRRARADIDREEDRGETRGLREREAGRIEGAIRFVESAISGPGGPGPGGPAPAFVPAPTTMPPPASMEHPAYLRALADLRTARWLLSHVPGDWVRAVEETDAMREIDGAIDEIRRASIDDGRDIDDHQAVDERRDRRGRLGDAESYLRRARADIEQEEDIGDIRGLRARAAEHIDGAIRFVDAAMRF
jgi:hypothetical protein